jgi:hypothetical protein
LRPPVTPERLALTADGQVRLALRQPWADGTTHVVFDPVEFLGRLAVLVPRPRVNLILYYGVLGARAAWRPEVVPRPPSGQVPAAGDLGDDGLAAAAGTAQRRARGQCWADLMRRTFPPPPFGFGEASPSRFHLRAPRYGGQVARRRANSMC